VSLIAIAGALFVALLTAFRPAENSFGGNTWRSPPLTVWTWNIAGESLNRMLPEFRRIHPEIPVRLELSGSNLSRSRFLLTLAAGKGAPDIAQVEAPYVVRFAATGQLRDLTDLAEPYEQLFPKAAWKPCTYRGHTYAIPWDLGPCVVFVKRGLLERHGIRVVDVKTWDDFILAGRQLDRRTRGKSKMLPLSIGEAAQFLEMLMQQTGAQYFDADGRIAFASAKTVAALDILRQLVKSRIIANISPFGPEMYASFNNESIACYPMPVWFGGMIDNGSHADSAVRFGWSAISLPAVEAGGLRTANRGGSTLVIPRQCRNALAAWKFIQFMLLRDESHVGHYTYRRLFPALRPALARSEFWTPDPLFGGVSLPGLVIDQLSDIPPLERTTDWAQAERHLNQVLYRWLTGDEPTIAFVNKQAQQLSWLTGREVSSGSAGTAPATSSTFRRGSAPLRASTHEDGIFSRH
jgi:lactose/L-arabinose transport system substrate-binding protein